MSEKDKNEASAAARALGIRKVDGRHEFDGKSLLVSMGGVQGILEAIVPGFIFVILFAFTREVFLSIGISASVSVAFILLRIVTRKPLAQAIGGLVGIGIASFLAFRDGGSGRDYFLTGFVTNLSYLIPLAVSVLIRWPLIGVITGFIIGEKTAWRKNKYEMRLFTMATLLWVGIFGSRLMVQWPLYLADNLTALATARLIMGLPLYAAGLWVTWLMLRGVIQRPR
ncbi:MAG: hypothetical protein RIR24_252 [Actinomycetota bacterium]